MSEDMVVSLVSEHTFGIWFLIGAALVFWMQAGFDIICLQCGEGDQDPNRGRRFGCFAGCGVGRRNIF